MTKQLYFPYLLSKLQVSTTIRGEIRVFWKFDLEKHSNWPFKGQFKVTCSSFWWNCPLRSNYEKVLCIYISFGQKMNFFNFFQFLTLDLTFFKVISRSNLCSFVRPWVNLPCVQIWTFGDELPWNKSKKWLFVNFWPCDLERSVQGQIFFVKIVLYAVYLLLKLQVSTTIRGKIRAF